MDKTIEIVIVATVVIMTALAVMFMVSGQAGDFGEWTNEREDQASCSLQKTQWENACSQGEILKPAKLEVKQLQMNAIGRQPAKDAVNNKMLNSRT